MTVGNKLHQTLASLRSAKADMETFALETQDKNAQQLFSNGARQLEQLINSVSGRTNYVEKQEPQYKSKQKMQNRKNQ
ncbi:DUF1657 domain-containing protein [Halothermothrix orenii]|uniref:DUF1657 domain-containing protein n=1 Tax=Halothermothrix orenii (strain H 168 / OCM 544 / DSM 9562) TaxID=373903 RepID=B8CYV6_HALOH|nr:DUF1657 domain-containing protein [Halothermothrix orenii]ACL70475.1 Protein of unknown function (DUF1657) [Halothermothrix orenii H 168]